MATVKNLVISAGRKVTANYNTRDVSFTVSLELAEGDNPKAVLDTWTGRLQQAVDQAVGDTGSPASFAGNRNAVTPK